MTTHTSHSLHGASYILVGRIRMVTFELVLRTTAQLCSLTLLKFISLSQPYDAYNFESGNERQRRFSNAFAKDWA